jgi:hypothetical protein
VVSFGDWVVVADVEAAATQQRVAGCLRDLGFGDILPCVFTDRWTPPRRDALERHLGRALRGGVGRVLVCRTGRTEPFWVMKRIKATG